MCKISKIMTKRRGFTLIEMLLVLAIMMMFIGFVFSTFYLVNSSHANVVVINDAKDFAALNMEAISKLVVNAEDVVLSGESSIEDDYTNIYYNIDDNDLCIKSTAIGGETLVFSYDDYTLSDGSKKWNIQPTFTASGTMLIVNLDVIDNASGSIYYTLTRTLLLPNVLKSDQFTVTGSSVIKFKDKF